MKFKKIFSILMVVVIFLSTTGISFVQHHCSVKNVTRNFVNEYHNCKAVIKHSEKPDCSKKSGHCHKCDHKDVELKGAKCCSDVVKTFSLNIPISFDKSHSNLNMTAQIFSLLPGLYDVCVCFECIYTDSYYQSPPLAYILPPDKYIHFISSLLI